MYQGRTPKSKCPSCKATLTGASNVGEVGPVPGDFSICWYCQAVMVFNDDLTLREPTEEDIAEVDTLKLSQMQRAAKRHRDEND